MPSAGVPRRARARRGEGDLLREEILTAAEQLLVETGDSAAVSIRAVADAVGVTPPSIYLHFADKTDLLFAVCERHYTALDEHIQAALAGIEDPLERLYRQGRAYIHFGIENPEHYRVLFMGRPDITPERFEGEQLRATAAFNHLHDDVLAAHAAGAFGEEQDPFVVSCGLWITVHGVTSLLITKPSFPWPPLETLIDHLLVGHGPR